MIKKILWAALLWPVAGFGQQKYSVQGKIGEVDSPAKIYLYYRTPAGEDQFDSTSVSKGEFKFHGDVPSSTKASLMLAHHPIKLKWFKEVMIKFNNDEDFRNESIDLLSLYLEPGLTTVNATDSLFKATVDGSPLNKDMSVLNQKRAPVYQSLKSIIAQFNEWNREGQITEKQVVGLEKAYKKGLSSLQRVDLDFAATHNASPISLGILEKYILSASVSQDIEPLFKKLKPNLRNSESGKQLAKEIKQYKITDVGQLAPGFIQPDTSGKLVSLKDYKGKYVLIDFWASWCGPCRNESPAVVYAYNTFKAKNFTVIGVSIDKLANKEKWLEAIRVDHTGQWAQVADLKGAANNEAAQIYHVKEIPQNFLIGPDGRIIAKNLRGSALQEILSNLLN